MMVMLFAFYQLSFSQSAANDLISSQIDAEVNEMMKEGDIPGVSVIIINGDKNEIRNYGYANLEKEILVTSNTLFELGSCTKAFTALAVANLVDQNKISLTSDVQTYLPWFKVFYEGDPVNIKVEHLLHHTSGIPWSTISKIPESNDENALEETIKAIAGQELEELPGQEYEYATVNYDILALIIEKVTHISFENYLQNEVLKKIGLDQTTIGEPKDDKMMSSGYKISFFQPRKYNAPRFKGNNAAGYVISNAEDISKWLQFQMGLLQLDFYEIAQQTHQRDETVPLHNMSSYAMGWEVSLSGNGEIYHSGLNPNFTSYITFRPDEKLGVAVLANSNSTYTPMIGDHVMKIIAGEKVVNEFDPGDRGDKTFSILSITLLVYLLILTSYFFWAILDIVNKKREFQGLDKSVLKKSSTMLLSIVPFILGLIILPQAIANFDWKSILVWTPESFDFMIKLVIGAMAASYFVYVFTMCFPEKNAYKRAIPRIVLMSILSGLSNVVAIIIITSAIGSDVDLEYIIYFYLLTISVYLLGRRFVQVNLIRFARGLVFDLRVRLVDKIFATSYQKFERIDRGRIYTVLNDDVNSIGQSTNIFVGLITSVITTIGAFIYLASIAFWATVLSILLIVALAAIYYSVVQSTNTYFEKARDERNIFMRLLNGMIDGFKEISLHRNKKHEYQEDITLSADRFRKKISIADVRFVNAFLTGESLLVVLLGVVAFGMPEFFPDMKLYTLMSFVVVLLYLIGPINGILNSVPGLMQLKVAWNRIHRFLEEIPADIHVANSIPNVENKKLHNLSLDQIEYEYKDTDGNTVFGIGPIDLTLKSGEITFIVGGNGSGKTTLAKLLTGLYKPTGGAVKINNHSLSNLELSEYFSVVFSPSHLFKKLYNIDARGKEKEIDALLNTLQLKEKVKIINNEYSTIDLSAGQRKRLALFQCYLENSPIYLFDEWAADQDPGFRNFFYRTLLPEMKAMGKTIIAITHDDHYFDVADTVYEMREGQLKQYRKELAIESVFSNE